MTMLYHLFLVASLCELPMAATQDGSALPVVDEADPLTTEPPFLYGLENLPTTLIELTRRQENNDDCCGCTFNFGNGRDYLCNRNKCCCRGYFGYACCSTSTGIDTITTTTTTTDTTPAFLAAAATSPASENVNLEENNQKYYLLSEHVLTATLTEPLQLSHAERGLFDWFEPSEKPTSSSFVPAIDSIPEEDEIECECQLVDDGKGGKTVDPRLRCSGLATSAASTVTPMLPHEIGGASFAKRQETTTTTASDDCCCVFNYGPVYPPSPAAPAIPQSPQIPPLPPPTVIPPSPPLPPNVPQPPIPMQPPYPPYPPYPQNCGTGTVNYPPYPSYPTRA